MNSTWSRLCLGGSFLFATLGVHGPRLLADTIGSTGAKTASAALFAAAGRATRAQPEGQPAPTPPASAATQATIAAFEGKVRYRLGADKEWLPAKVGAVLAEGAEVETGLRSAIQIRIGTGQVLTIDRASRVAIREAIARAGTEKTTVDLPYGRVKFEVSSASVANDVKIQAPDATLAVKGTKGYMEVTPGQPTLAAGDEGNTGSFEVAYDDTGTTATVDQQLTTDASNPDPAFNSLTITQIDVGSPAARSGDETQVITRAPGGGESLSLIAPGAAQGIRNTPPVAVGSTDFLFLSGAQTENIALVRQSVLTNETLVLRSDPTFANSFNFSNGLGLALGRTASGTERELFRLEQGASGGGFRLLGLSLGMPDSAFQIRATGSDNITGLAALGSRLFSFGTGGVVNNHLVELNLPSGTTTPRMFLPFGQVGRDLAGSNERGSVWVFGSGTSRGNAPFIQGTFLEVDPRTNHVLRTSGPLAVGDTTFFDTGLSGSSLNGAQVVGLAFAGGNIIAQLTTEGGTLFVTINPNAGGTVANPTITRVTRSADAFFGLASESFNLPAASAPLAPLGTAVIDPSLNPLFAQMAFGPAAITSTVFRQMLIAQIIDTAADPTGCAAANPFSSFQSFLSPNANRIGGTGIAINQFRESLGPGHPCLYPGQVVALPEFLYLTDMGQLIGRSIAGVETVLRTGLEYNLDAFDTGGLALVQAAGSRTLFRLESQGILEGGATLTQVLLSLDLNSASSQFQIVNSFLSDGPFFGGLGAIGANLYAGGIPQGQGAGNGFAQYGIFQLLPTFNQRMALPFDFVDPEIAGSNQRGSLFITGDVDASNIRGSIFEVDPRNNYVRNAVRLEFGPSTVFPAGFDPAIFDQHEIVVTGSAFAGGRLLLAVRDDTTGQRYFIEINPDALGTAASPTVVRVSQSTRHVLGLGASSTVAPPASISLASPTSPIDTSLGLFGSTAYSSLAAASDPFRRMVAESIASTAVNPTLCRSQITLSVLGGFLSSHVNQMSGVGQAASDFRASLNPGHPCLLPGAANLDDQVFYFDPTTSLVRVLGFSGPNLSSDSPLATTQFPTGFGTGLGFALARSGGGTLFHLQSTGSPGAASYTIRSVPLATPSANPATIASQSGSTVPLLFGLGIIEELGQTRFFAPGFDSTSFSDGIYEISPGTGTQRRVSLPGLDLDLSFTAATTRGTVFLFASDATLDTPSFAQRLILEIDPRNNHLVGVTNIALGPSTGIPVGFDPNTITDVVGLAFINGRLVATVITSSGDRAFVNIDINAAGTTGDPSVRNFNTTTNFPTVYAANRPGPAPSPVAQGTESSPPDLRVDKVFAEMSYAGLARVLSAVNIMLTDHITFNGLNAVACLQSPEFATVPSLTASHAGQRRGIGQTLSDFYNSIDYLHPCQLTPDQLRFTYVDESTGNLLAVDIDGNVRGSRSSGASINPIDRANAFGDASDGGFAIVQPASLNLPAVFLRLETVRTSASVADHTFRFFNDSTSAFVQAGAPIQITGGDILSGLGAVGDRVFAGRIGPSGASIVEINSPLNTPTLGPTRIDFPGLGFGGAVAIGSAPARGTLFASATINGLVAIVELDPRNNYLADAYSAFGGQLTIDPNTANAAALSSFNSVNLISSIAYNNGLLNVAGTRSDTMGPVVFTVDTAGTNGTSRPIVGSTRLNNPAGGPTGPIGAATTLSARPLAPLSLTDPGGAIDMRGLSAQFADLAYSQRALNSGAVNAIARAAILNSASDPSGCASSSEILNNLGPALQNRVAQRAGFGRAITDFRNSLPGGHPCLPPP